jgi:hypothetical protein
MMQYVAVVTDTDDLEVRAVLGPYDNPDDALADGDEATALLEDNVLPGHARIHNHEHEVMAIETYNEFLIRMQNWMDVRNK